MDFAYADELNRTIRIVALKHRARAAALLADLGLYPGQEIVLLELDTLGPRKQAELAVSCECEPPTVSQLVRKLEIAGLITRQPSTTDARAIVVDLTDRGRALMGPLKSRWIELAEVTAAGLETTKPDELLSVVHELARSLCPAAALRLDQRFERRSECRQRTIN
ncbi:MAG: MarR family transcriptional regulator [Geodermatophilaceae bacterium]|jgi:DNA-binding MarR family transcriptional regulator|nr:MarR family transcriptional regulator [Geodermatophilaceae bacterium]